jgi:hypothetical protein
MVENLYSLSSRKMLWKIRKSVAFYLTKKRQPLNIKRPVLFMMTGTSKFLTSVSLEVIEVVWKGVGCGHLPSVTNQHVTKCYTRPRTWTDSLT